MKRKIRLRKGKEEEESGVLGLQCPASCSSGLRDRKLHHRIKGNSGFDRISAVFLPPLTSPVADSYLSLTSLSAFHLWWAVHQKPCMGHIGGLEAILTLAVGQYQLSHFPHEILNTWPILLPMNICILGGWKRDHYILQPQVIRRRQIPNLENVWIQREEVMG